jgi:hypothetical protein
MEDALTARAVKAERERDQLANRLLANWREAFMYDLAARHSEAIRAALWTMELEDALAEAVRDPSEDARVLERFLRLALDDLREGRA